MIVIDNVDKKSIMKDIIAAQHVQPRRRPSLLKEAAQYRSLTKPFVQGNFAVQEKKVKKQRHKKASAPVLGGVEMFSGKNRKNRFILAGILLTLLFVPVTGVLLELSFIPDPEPPEEQVRLASYGAFNLSQPQGSPSPDGGVEIPLDMTETFAWLEYKVKSGDSVEGIARRFGLSLDAIIASNDISNVRRLRAGEKIRIPNMDGIPYTVKNGDSYSKIAVSMQVPLEVILDANDIQSEAINAGAVLFIPGAKMTKEALREALGDSYILPVNGRRTSLFGWRNDPFTGVRNFHAGLDLAAPLGTPVKAAGDGRVSATGYNAVYGNFIIITHSGGYQTMYGHLNKILVNKGVSVSQGKVIGQVGSTGRSTGAHLHFAAYKNGRAINPLELINK